MKKQNKRNIKSNRKAIKAKAKTAVENFKVKEAPIASKAIGSNPNSKRAIDFTLEMDGETKLRSFTVYNDGLIKELVTHNKSNKVTSQSSVDTFLEHILPNASAFVDDRLDIGNTNPNDVQKHIVGELMYGLGSIMLSNEYWSVWATGEDIVFNLKITIDSDGFIGVNSFRNTEGQVFNLRKGIETAYNEVKKELNLISYS